MLKQIVTPKAINIISLTDMKSYVSEVDSSKDAEVTSILEGVIGDGENITNRQFGVATFELYLSDLKDEFSLPKNPIKTISKIEYMDLNETYQILDSSKYYLYEDYELGKIKLKEVITVPSHKQAVKITFTCGYDSLPEPLVNWIKYQVMCLYDDVSAENKFIDNLIRKYRILSV